MARAGNRATQGRSRPRIRDDFPFLDGRVYFNSASCSPSPEPVVAAMADFYRQSPINYRSGQTPSEEAVTDRVDGIRDHLAAFIGADSAKEIVLTKNTTEAINLVARGLDPRAQDEVIVSRIEHQSNLLPWIKLAAEKGMRLKYLEPDSVGRMQTRRVRSEI